MIDFCNIINDSSEVLNNVIKLFKAGNTRDAVNLKNELNQVISSYKGKTVRFQKGKTKKFSSKKLIKELEFLRNIAFYCLRNKIRYRITGSSVYILDSFVDLSNDQKKFFVYLGFVNRSEGLQKHLATKQFKPVWGAIVRDKIIKSTK